MVFDEGVIKATIHDSALGKTVKVNPGAIKIMWTSSQDPTIEQQDCEDNYVQIAQYTDGDKVVNGPFDFKLPGDSFKDIDQLQFLLNDISGSQTDEEFLGLLMTRAAGNE